MVTAQDKLLGGHGWLRTLAELHEGPAENQHISTLDSSGSSSQLGEIWPNNKTKQIKKKNNNKNNTNTSSLMFALQSTTLIMTIIARKSVGTTVCVRVTCGPDEEGARHQHCPWC